MVSITDEQLSNVINLLGCVIFFMILAYHFIQVNTDK